jgi:hypothetical protein
MASPGDQYTVTMPIPSKSLAFARAMSIMHGQSEIKQRVFNNGIALITIHRFFELLGIESHYESSDLCNPAVQIAADLSELEIQNVGLLECRWVSAEDGPISVPFEAWGDRIGYTFVSFDLEALSATIHGFLPRVTREWIPRSELRSVEFMLQYLDSLIKSPQLGSTSSLTRWLAGSSEFAWEANDSGSLSSPPLEGVFRGALVYPSDAPVVSDSAYGGTACRTKTLAWQPLQGINSSEQAPEPLVLVVEINQGAPLLARVTIQVHPESRSLCLPPQLVCSIVDPAGRTIIQATSRSIDNYLQLPFKGEPGESFQVKLVLNQYQIIEHFQI